MNATTRPRPATGETGDAPPENLAVTRRVTGLTLLASAALSVAGFVVLGSAFGWPDVLDEPGTTALDKFAAAESSIRSGFYVMALSSLVLIPAAFGLRTLVARDTTLARTVTAFGVLGAFAQLLGWLRWVVAVPVQADLWTAAANDQERHAVAAAYDTLNAYAGGTLGEHLGWLLQSLWAVGIFAYAVRSSAVARWVSIPGLVLSVGYAALVPLGTATGWEVVETLGVNVVYTAWYIWLLVTGAYLVVRRRHA